MNFEGKPIIIPEQRYQELIGKELHLDGILKANPELESTMKLTPAAKKYKSALSDFVDRVEKVIGSKEFLSVFEISHVHGFAYKGESLAKDIVLVKQILGR